MLIILMIKFYFIYTLFSQERENNLYVDQKIITTISVVSSTILLSNIDTNSLLKCPIHFTLASHMVFSVSF